MSVNRRRLIPVLVVLVILTAVAWWSFGARDARSENGIAASGTVEATDADLGFQVGGRIATLTVREGESVAAGAELARLDASELEARRAAAVAQLNAARALLAELERGSRPGELAQAWAAEAAARERMAEAARVLERMRALYEGGAVSRQTLDSAETAHEVASAQHAQAREQAELVQSGARAERVDAQRAQVQQAAAVVAQVDAALEHAIIRAPFAGIVTVRHREPGEAVSPGAPVLTIMNPADRWVRIYVREDEMGNVALGQRAEIRTDTDPGEVHAGRVTFIASSAEFTPRNVQTPEERVRLVYAVKVHVESDPAMKLKPGVPADVRLLPET